MEGSGREKPLISVIVPVYNIREYLPRCVASLRAQTYPRLEILLVDDGSTDGTGALCESLAGEDPRIRVFHKENGGSSSARNLGIEKARGELLGFVDSDDYVEPDMYGLLEDAIERFQAPAAQVGRDEIGERGERLPDICRPPRETVRIPAEEFLEELLMHRGDCSFCTKLIRREFFEGHRFPLGALNEDFHLLLEMLPGLGAVVSLPPQAYHVFYRRGSNTRREDSFSRVFADNVDNADYAERLVEERYPELKDTVFRFGIVQRLDYMLHIPIPQMKRENETYQRIAKDLKKSWARSMRNPILTRKNKLYHTLFAAAPRTVRRIHKRLRGL